MGKIHKLTATFLGIWIGAWAQAGAPPLLPRPTEVKLTPSPETCAAVSPDSRGGFWITDRDGAVVLHYGADGRLLGKVGKGRGGTILNRPVGLALSQELLAVDDNNERILLFRLSDLLPLGGIEREVLHGDMHINPSAGFAPWAGRLFFGGVAFEGPIPPYGSDATALILFSTNLRGGDADVLLREHVAASQRPALSLFGSIHFARWGDGEMAVCRSLPPQVWVLGRQGKILRSGKVFDAVLPDLPVHALDGAQQPQAILSTPHVCGLFSAGDFLGGVVQHEEGGRPVFTVYWLDRELRLAGTQRLDLPGFVDMYDLLPSVAGDGKEKVFLLHVRRPLGAPERWHLYQVPLKFN